MGALLIRALLFGVHIGPSGSVTRASTASKLTQMPGASRSSTRMPGGATHEVKEARKEEGTKEGKEGGKEAGNDGGKNAGNEGGKRGWKRPT